MGKLGERGGIALAARTGEALAAAGDVRALLTRTELARADALRSAGDRDDFLAAHALVRLCAGRLLGCPAQSLTVVQSCGQCDRPHGRPRLVESPGLGVSFAHTRGWVAAVAAHGPVGIDVEADGGGPLDWRLAQLACNERELAALRAHPDPRRAFLRQWVRKESLVKVGVASLDELGCLDVPVYGDEAPRWRDWRLTDWRLTDWGGGGAVGCVAAREHVRLRLLGPVRPHAGLACPQ
ncbi:4'-phosphopantetheinyl transferase superfamily protein [Streptomyces sp. A3M-1-3]|uniref:4'-phosphopantetheinyl transferase family protein n=1 Tax=Streptomyces sp. A3M-1-3 TaxID=2962044 RepID=UPI0020B88CDE|nr:4'-phosphopantetheinyl transferase superfamily protein [Streptomyces sp. A3M-1-3]MCP3818636.1 4'-phosphopantetheinyl transferase superfamily protein [Streptomyces sp. A3M-1-3]